MFEPIEGFDQGLAGQFRRLEAQLDDLFGGLGAWPGTRNIRSLPPGAFPAINVAATPESVTVFLFAPGLDAKQLDISIQQNLLSISGERAPSPAGEATYYRQERFSGSFRRTLSLPEDVDAEQVEAKYADGVVIITVRRRESAKPRQIQVQ